MDVFGIVYIIENPQQFWSGAALCAKSIECFTDFYPTFVELEDILRLSEEASLEQLDSTLARFIHFCARYHGELSCTIGLLTLL